jgi:hypothetical protein
MMKNDQEKMDTYSVEADQTGFGVRRIPPAGGPGEIVASFPTRREAAGLCCIPVGLLGPWHYTGLTRWVRVGG